MNVVGPYTKASIQIANQTGLFLLGCRDDNNDAFIVS